MHLGTGADARCASIVRSASRLFARSARFFSSCTSFAIAIFEQTEGNTTNQKAALMRSALTHEG
jgi:hypothetical protein